MSHRITLRDAFGQTVFSLESQFIGEDSETDAFLALLNGEDAKQWTIESADHRAPYRLVIERTAIGGIPQ